MFVKTTACQIWHVFFLRHSVVIPASLEFNPLSMTCDRHVQCSKVIMPKVLAGYIQQLHTG